MTKRERLLCAIRGGTPDRVPVSIYRHSTVHHRGVGEFVDFTLDFHRRFDPDYVKVMYDELYDTPVNYQYAVDETVWGLLEDLDPRTGAFGRYLESLKRIRDAVDPDTPVVATVFAPFHIAVRLAWKRLPADCRAHGELVTRGLSTIGRNLGAFVRAAREQAGVDGFFLGAFGCEPAWLTREEYLRFALPGDLALLDRMRLSDIVFVHCHGERDSYFDLFESCAADALSWEDRLAGPSLREARARTPKCLVGGVDHVAATSASPDAVRLQALDAIEATGGRGFILAPGCTFLEGTPEENMLALRRAAEERRPS